MGYIKLGKGVYAKERGRGVNSNDIEEIVRDAIKDGMVELEIRMGGHNQGSSYGTVEVLAKKYAHKYNIKIIVN